MTKLPAVVSIRVRKTAGACEEWNKGKANRTASRSFIRSSVARLSLRQSGIDSANTNRQLVKNLDFAQPQVCLSTRARVLLFTSPEQPLPLPTGELVALHRTTREIDAILQTHEKRYLQWEVRLRVLELRGKRL